MKLFKRNDFIEQLSKNEISVLRGGFSSNEQADCQALSEGKIIYINGKPYRIEKDGSIKPLLCNH